ncbi:MAG: sigma-54 dependent transcriptional regulator [Pseudomonadota bacterium]
MTGKVPAEGNGGESRVLVVEDERLYARALVQELRRRGVAGDIASSGAAARTLAEGSLYGAILLDHKLPDADGLELIPLLMGRQPGATVVIMTAYETIENAIHAIRLGAEDYLVKETSVTPIVERILEIRRRTELRAAWTRNGHPKAALLLGESPGIRRVAEDLQKVSRAPDTTVLLTGETGVGKEVAARQLHALTETGAARRPFVTVDCVALPGTLVESMLFGHMKGSFTGADRTSEGAFHDAGDGSLFLDEVGDMEPALQGKLLRVLESRTFQRVGAFEDLPFHARTIAATNRDLEAEVARGTFRFDLFQRLSVFPIQIPPLRERGEDVLLLANHFVETFARRMGQEPEPLSPEVRDRLLAYDYPGNVRELKNIIERAVVLGGSGRIEASHLPERLHRRIRGAAHSSVPIDFIPGVDTLATVEIKMIRHALDQVGGSRTEAARLLGISRFQLLRRLEKHGLRDDSDP